MFLKICDVRILIFFESNNHLPGESFSRSLTSRLRIIVGTNPSKIPRTQIIAAAIHLPTPVLCRTAWKKLCFSFGFSHCFFHFSSKVAYKPSASSVLEHFPRSSKLRERLLPALISLVMKDTLHHYTQRPTRTSSMKTLPRCPHSCNH